MVLASPAQRLGGRQPPVKPGAVAIAETGVHEPLGSARITGKVVCDG